MEQVAAIQQLLPEGATLELEETEMVYQQVKEEVTLEGDITWHMVDNVDHVNVPGKTRNSNDPDVIIYFTCKYTLTIHLNCAYVQFGEVGW